MSELVDLTLKRIKDKRLRHIVIGSENPDEKTITGKIIYCMNNIMLMSFFGFFSLWKRFRNVTDIDGSTANIRRINETFSDIYNGTPLSLEVISFLLTEIQLDAGKNIASPYREYVRNKITYSKFQRITEIIRVWKINYKHAEQNIETLTSLYVGLLESLPILRKMSINDSDGGMRLTIVFDDDDEYTDDISLFVKLIEHDFECDYYYLYKAAEMDNSMYLEYTDFSGSNSCSGDGSGPFTSPVSEFRAAIGYDGRRKRSKNAVTNLNMLNFKYIRRLAMAVSDVLGNGTKRMLKEAYANNAKYKDIFSEESDSLNWDNVMVLLMLEEGPSDIIEVVLKNDVNAFDNILRNVAIRFELDHNKLTQKYRQILSNEERYEKTQHRGFDVNKTVRSWRRNAEISLMSQFLVSAVTDTDIDNVTTNAFYAESLSMKKKKIESSRKDGNETEVIRLLNKTLERIFRMLIVFYKGIIAYAQKKEEMLKDVIDVRSRQSDEFLSVLQNNCEKAFFDSVEESMEEKDRVTGKTLANSSLGVLVKMFEDLCRGVDDKRGEHFVCHGNSGKLLHSVLGRNAICDISQMRRIMALKQGEINDTRNYPKDLLSFFNKYLKHDDPSVDIWDVIIEKYYSRCIELLKFFAFNKDYEKEGGLCHQSIYDPIFPYVVRYSEKSENRDKCSVCQYVINTDGEFDKTMGVKLLTEFDYKINELYYCIPNAECSTKNWWVAPFLISCRKFDRIFLKLSLDEDESEL